jgi:hypothetical protein
MSAARSGFTEHKLAGPKLSIYHDCGDIICKSGYRPGRHMGGHLDADADRMRASPFRPAKCCHSVKAQVSQIVTSVCQKCSIIGYVASQWPG